MNRRPVNVCALMLLLCLCTVHAWADTRSDKRYNIVFIGNSITQGAGLSNPEREAPPAQAVVYLQKQPAVAAVKYANKGVSGCTTVDYLPETETLFPRMQEAADLFANDSRATLVFSVMLGTNDSAVRGTNGCPVSPDQYQVNMRKIIDRLLLLYPSCKVILNRPVWYSPNTYNGAMYMQEGLDRLESYYPELKTLVTWYAVKNPGHVLLGDTAGFDHFRKHYKAEYQEEAGNAGAFYLHPNAQGAVSLGELWGKALYKNLVR